MKKKKLIIWAIVIIVAIILFITMGIPYIKRHFVTNDVEVSKVVAGDQIENDKKILVVYFTRVGNSNFDDDVEAVSGASLLIDGDTLVGNSQLLAQMIKDATGGDIYAIETKDKYPSTYADTIGVAKEEFDQEKRPELVGELPKVSEYDTVFVVYPLWWYRLPMAVVSFLESADFTEGVELVPIVTHGGSGAAKSIDEIKGIVPSQVNNPGITFFDDDVIDSRATITDVVKKVLGE